MIIRGTKMETVIMEYSIRDVVVIRNALRAVVMSSDNIFLKLGAEHRLKELEAAIKEQAPIAAKRLEVWR